MKKISIILLICFAFAGIAYSETFKITYISEKPKEIKACEKDSGKYLWGSRNMVVIGPPALASMEQMPVRAPATLPCQGTGRKASARLRR